MFKARNKKCLAIWVSLLLSACGGSGNPSTTAQTPSAPDMTVAQALKSGDQSGAFPTLNRDSTVSGPDTDANGIRDDIDAYIAALPDTPVQKAAMRQTAIALANALTVDITNQSALRAVSNQLSAAASCLYARYDTTAASKKSREIEKYTVNTKIRFLAYEKYNSAMNGKSMVLPQGGGCVN